MKRNNFLKYKIVKKKHPYFHDFLLLSNSENFGTANVEKQKQSYFVSMEVNGKIRQRKKVTSDIFIIDFCSLFQFQRWFERGGMENEMKLNKQHKYAYILNIDFII